MTFKKPKLPTHEDGCDAFINEVAEIESVIACKEQASPFSTNLPHEAKFVVGGVCMHCLASRFDPSDLAEYFEAAVETAESELFDAAMCLYAFEGLIAASFERGDTLDEVVADGLKSCQDLVSEAKERLRLAKAAYESMPTSNKPNLCIPGILTS